MDTGTRLVAWSEVVEHDAAAWPGLVDDAARRTVRHVDLAIKATEAGRKPDGEVAGLAVEELMAKGWGAMTRAGVAGTAGRAGEYFGEVLRREPEHATAMASGTACASLPRAGRTRRSPPRWASPARPSPRTWCKPAASSAPRHALRPWPPSSPPRPCEQSLV